MCKLEEDLHRKATDEGILLKDGSAISEPVRSRHIMKTALMILALATLAAGLSGLFKPGVREGKPPSPPPGKEVTPDGSLHKLSPWAFLAGNEWMGFTAHVGLKLTDEEVALLLLTQAVKDEADTSGLQVRLLKWSRQVKEEMRLPSEQPQEIESSRTLRVMRNARVSGDRVLPAGWITNFKDQRNRYDNEQRSAAVELADFLRDIEKEDKPDELRPIIDRACNALVEFKGAGVFFDLIKSKAQELQPCPKGWSVPTLRDVQRLSVIKQLLSSPAFVKLAFDDPEVSRPVSTWKDIHNLCQKGRKNHDAAGSAEQGLFESLLK